MLLPEITPGVRQALSAAHAWSAAMGASEVSAAHTLLGLLAEEDWRPAQLFQQQGLSRPALLAALQVQSDSISVPQEPPAALDSYLQGLLYDARLLALEFADSHTVTTELLLLALLERDEPLRTQLGQLGFDTQKLRDQFQAGLGPEITLDQPLNLVDTHEAQSISRILDANANRAREALRILEETARFHLNDLVLSKLAKGIRHDLTDAFRRHLPRQSLIVSRETQADVGTQVSTPGESYRPSIQAVIQANAQRLQEALRCLEEYGKVLSPELGRSLEAVRYRSYTLERGLQIGVDARERLGAVRLYLLVSKASCLASLEWTIREAAAGGASIIQLREKTKTDRELLIIAQEVRQVTKEVGILFIMNDRPDLAHLAHADGVHLGQDDLQVHAARTILGPLAIIGVSTHNPHQLERAVLDGADYIGVGPTFASETKAITALAGLDYLRHAAGATGLPAFAIGGIHTGNVQEVVGTGIRRIAVGKAICQAEDPRSVAGQLLAALRP